MNEVNYGKRKDLLVIWLFRKLICFKFEVNN